MSNNNTVIERIKTLLEGYSGLSTYLKKVYIHTIDFFALIPDVMTPAVVLNDGGEILEEVENRPGSGRPREKVIVRNHKVELYCVVKYDDSEIIVIGDTNFIGLLDFSKLVETALLSDKRLSSNYDDLTYAGWEAITITNPENPTVFFATGRKTILTYKCKPENI